MKVGLSIRLGLYFKHVVIVFCRDPPTSILERLLSCVKIALTVNRFFFLKPVQKYLYKFYE